MTYEKCVWLKKEKIKCHRTRTGAYLGINYRKCNQGNNDIFLLYLALHETSTCQAEAATELDKAPALNALQPARSRSGTHLPQSTRWKSKMGARESNSPAKLKNAVRFKPAKSFGQALLQYGTWNITPDQGLWYFMEKYRTINTIYRLYHFSFLVTSDVNNF